ncbi:MAG: alpha/beta hydrolase [Pseudomonadota bacterium]
MDDTDMAAPETLDLGADRVIAYHRTPGAGGGIGAAGILFLGGFRSDMTGTKAQHLEAWAKASGRAFLRFDYRGHGASSAAFEDGAIGDWADDAAEVLARLTEGPQILVGSSMGGWIALLLARAHPDRVAGIVGIAAAPDFTEDSMWAELDEAGRARLLTEGRIELPSDYSDEPYVITRRLIEEGREQLVLRDPLPLPMPVRLLHGTADVDVPVERGLLLLDHMACPDAWLTLVKGSDHRFSEPADLALIVEAVESLS